MEYFGPCNITIPPLSVAVVNNAAVHINGTLYSCVSKNSRACYKYNLVANCGTWEPFTTIAGFVISSPEFSPPAVAFEDFFWIFDNKIRQVPINGSSVTSFDWQYGMSGCAVGNGSHTVMIQLANSSVLMNSDPTTPTIWTIVAELKILMAYGGCLWHGNTIYVTGGVDDELYAISTTQLINTDTFEVTLGAPLPIVVYLHGMGVIDGNPAVFGGRMGGDCLSTIYVYDNSTNTWSLSARSLTQAVAEFGSVTYFN